MYRQSRLGVIWLDDLGPLIYFHIIRGIYIQEGYMMLAVECLPSIQKLGNIKLTS